MPNSYLQIVFRGTYWARIWSLLSKEETREFLKKMCRRLEGVLLDFGASSVGNCRRRLGVNLVDLQLEV
jgi:hypothetical protein